MCTTNRLMARKASCKIIDPPPLLPAPPLPNADAHQRTSNTHRGHGLFEFFFCGSSTGLLAQLRQLQKMQLCRCNQTLCHCDTGRLPIDSDPKGHSTTTNLAAWRFGVQRQGTLLGAFHSTLHGSECSFLSCFIDSNVVCRCTVWESSASTSPCHQPSLRRTRHQLAPCNQLANPKGPTIRKEDNNRFWHRQNECNRLIELNRM